MNTSSVMIRGKLSRRKDADGEQMLENNSGRASAAAMTNSVLHKPSLQSGFRCGSHPGRTEGQGTIPASPWPMARFRKRLSLGELPDRPNVLAMLLTLPLAPAQARPYTTGNKNTRLESALRAR